jgi:uncharacterized protein YdcH (DUF465 family)
MHRLASSDAQFSNEGSSEDDDLLDAPESSSEEEKDSAPAMKVNEKRFTQVFRKFAKLNVDIANVYTKIRALLDTERIGHPLSTKQRTRLNFDLPRRAEALREVARQETINLENFYGPLPHLRTYYFSIVKRRDLPRVRVTVPQPHPLSRKPYRKVERKLKPSDVPLW